MVARENIPAVYAGSDYRQALKLYDNAAALIDLTGYTFRGQARIAYSDTNPSFSFSFVLRDQVADKGVVDMRIAAADTTALSISKITKYLYDIEMVTPSGDIVRIVEGVINLHPEVTK